MGLWSKISSFFSGKSTSIPYPSQPAFDAEYADEEAYVRRYGPPMMDVDTIRQRVADGRGPLAPKAFDAMANWMSGQGGMNDPAMATRYLFAATLDWQTISNMCRASWLARRIVWRRPKDMMRPGYQLVFEGMGDKIKGSTNTNGDRLRYAITRKWDADNKLIEAQAWAREFGGSVIVIDVKGQLLSDPLPIKDGMVDYSSIGKGGLNSLNVWDRWRANHNGEMDNDSNSPNRGKPSYYVLSADAGLSGQLVHWTRVISFDGDIVDWWTWRANACWNDSVLQVAIDTLKQYDSLTNAISSLVPKARQDIVYAEHAAKSASTAAGRKALGERYAVTHRMASNYNVRIFDMKSEKVEQQTYSFANLDHIWEKGMMESGACAGYPSSVLFDNQPSGLNASGDASLEGYYNDLGADRLNVLKPRQIALYEVIARNEFGELPMGFDIIYNPFRTASEMEKSSINKNRADADHIRIVDGIITPGLVAAELKEDSVYKTMDQEDVDLAKLAPPPTKEPDDGGLESEKEETKAIVPEKKEKTETLLEGGEEDG